MIADRIEAVGSRGQRCTGRASAVDWTSVVGKSSTPAIGMPISAEVCVLYWWLRQEDRKMA
jgi:hypothetical protein